MPENPEIPDPGSSVDLTKRYDVYCSRPNQQTVVYRNVLFKGARQLFSTNKFDVLSHFLELELPDGQSFFITRHGITAFCEHGKKLGEEFRDG